MQHVIAVIVVVLWGLHLSTNMERQFSSIDAHQEIIIDNQRIITDNQATITGNQERLVGALQK